MGGGSKMHYIGNYNTKMTQQQFINTYGPSTCTDHKYFQHQNTTNKTHKPTKMITTKFYKIIQNPKLQINPSPG